MMGAPIWPAGAVGSISHTDDIAVAVVARSEEVQAIGLDIERVGAVEPGLWPMLFSETERLRLEGVAPHARDTLATALFAAKEAFYKAQWPITGEWLDFLDIEVELNGHTFVVLPRSQKAWTRRLAMRLGGSLAIPGDIVAAAILISAS
jgi:4'-phosphopantetheinyl transferase EntD